MQQTKWLILLSLILLFVLIYLISVGIKTYLRVNHGERLAKSTSIYTKEIQSNKNILILGDSIAYGVGASSNCTSFAGQIGLSNPSDNIINKAQIGATTESLAESIEKNIDRYYNQIYIIIGSNDITRYKIDLEHTKKNLDSIILKASTNADKVFLYTSTDFNNVSIVPRIFSKYFSNRSEQIRDYSINIAQKYENVIYIDVFNMEHRLYETLEANDGFHLNDNGILALIMHTGVESSRIPEQSSC